MRDIADLTPPDNLDWRSWVRRWDRMQDRYLVRRTERFDVIVRLIHAIRDSAPRVLDLGCGTGTLMLSVLDACPDAEVWGIDFDPTILFLARARLAEFGDRVRILLGDMRLASWTDTVPGPFDAVISATSLHWFAQTELAALYARIPRVLRPGGIFLNADHVASDCPRIQAEWERHRAELRALESPPDSDDWSGFWAAYSQALGVDTTEIQQGLGGGWERGIEEGLPLAWHLDQLRQCGFVSVDCFWRSDCDAIYGGIRGSAP